MVPPDGTRITAAHYAFLASLYTFSRSLPRIPLCAAFCTLCRTSGHFLHRGLLRQHFFFGLAKSSFFTHAFR